MVTGEYLCQYLSLLWVLAYGGKHWFAGWWMVGTASINCSWLGHSRWPECRSLACPCKTTTNRFLWETASVNWLVLSHIVLFLSAKMFSTTNMGDQEQKRTRWISIGVSHSRVPRQVLSKIQWSSSNRFQQVMHLFSVEESLIKTLRALVCCWFAVLLCFMDSNCRNVEFTGICR